jgi:hypothetical protein
LSSASPTALTREEVARRGGQAVLAKRGRQFFKDMAVEREKRARELAKLAPPLTPEEIIALRQLLASQAGRDA